MKKVIIIESIVIILLVLWVILLSLSKRTISMHLTQEKTELSEIDLKIFQGDTVTYGLCNIQHSRGDLITNRDYALYSYIMAEKHNDPFAAQQFADCVLQNDSLNKDTSWVRVIFPYLQFAADTFLCRSPVSSESAAYWMAQIYSGHFDLLPTDTAKYSIYLRKYKEAIRKTVRANNHSNNCSKPRCVTTTWPVVVDTLSSRSQNEH